MDTCVLAKDIHKVEDVGALEQVANADIEDDMITKEDLIAADVVVECEARQFEDEGFDDDMLLEF